ncbi:MAG: sugar phosphate isomerase/epimerase family protein [Christensenellales bacterium]|jgi:L-ribulose-5-phosphate 3-epimerase
MYKSINQWSFPSGMTVPEMMRLAKISGFEGFEPALSETGALSLESADGEFLALKRTAEDIGIKLTSLASGLTWSYSPTSNDENIRKIAKEQVRRQLECAKLLGVDAILFVPATVGSGFWGGADDPVKYEDAWYRTIDNLNDLKGYAEELGVTIGVENVWNNFLMSPREFRELIDTVDSPRVKVYLDVGNVLKYGWPEQWIDILGCRICRVHVKDFKREVGTLAGFVDLLSGDVNFPAVIDALNRNGYEGPLTAEMGVNSVYPEDIVFRTARALEKILGER